MITYNDFKAKYTGKLVDANGNVPGQGAYGQCVDIVNLYIKEVLGFPIVLGTNAIDFPKKCLPPNYTYILNDINAVPIQGDLMIYKSPDGIGHIDIFDNGNASKFVSFSQNWPLKSVCKLVNHTYTGTYSVVGWLRGNVIIDDMTNEQKKILDFIGTRTEGDVRAAFGALTDNPGLQTNITSLTTANKGLQAQVDTLTKQIADLKTSLDNLTKQVNDFKTEVTADQKTEADYQIALSSADNTISNLQATLDSTTTDRQKYKNLYENALTTQTNKYTALQLFSMAIKNLFIKK